MENNGKGRREKKKLSRNRKKRISSRKRSCRKMVNEKR
jgi:hypothetical protein